jgi:lipoyl(octanoyl) transferase
VTANPSSLVIRDLGVDCDYQEVWDAMRDFTDQRNEKTSDELWLLEHPPVFTQGQAGKAEHVLAPGDIAVIQVDRGGQVTYHGPGQLVIYVMIDLKRLGLGVRALVSAVEESIVALLASYGIIGVVDPKAPGVYVDGAKVAQVGMRIRKGCSFHGMSLNLTMDLEPFGRINPCGYVGQKICRLIDLVNGWDIDRNTQAREQLVQELSQRLGYTTLQQISGLRFSVDT